MSDPIILVAAAILVWLGVAMDWVPGLTSLDQQRIGQVALLGLTAAVWLARTRSGLAVMRALPVAGRGSLALFFALGLVSVCYAPMTKWAALEWANFFLLTALAMWLARALAEDGARATRGLTLLLAAVATVAALKVMTGYVAALMEGVRLDTLLLFEGTFSNRRFFGQLATLLIPLLAWQALVATRFRTGWMLLAVAWWMLALASGTRGSWLALAAAHGAVWLVLGRRAWPYMRVQIGAFVVGGAAYGLLFYGVPQWLGMEAGVENRLGRQFADLSQRDVIWELALQHMQAHPWLGIGPMHYAAYVNPVAAHPHNALLQLAAEWGVPAMLAAAGLALYGLICFARPLLAREVAPLRLALLIALAGAGIQSMVDGVIVIPYTQTWLAIVAGWALGVHIGSLPETPSPERARDVTMVRIALAAAFAGLLSGVWPEILDRANATSRYLEHHDSLAPRYWAQGWIR